MNSSEPRPPRLLLGVTGGIAAYKAADLASKAVGQGWEVRVIMTRAATQFVGPVTFEALTGHPVFIDVLETGAAPDGASAVRHIYWARWPDVVCIAPLTQSTLARLAVGLADDALLTVVHALAPSVPVLLAPAMNTQMWEHPTTRRNIAWLDDTQRYRWVKPIAKRLACGEEGEGALAETSDLLQAIQDAYHSRQPASSAP
jgi:phosphopantothenoylcysteine decarboxylase/phosphopantothenate--cysteine ligase